MGRKGGNRRDGGRIRGIGEMDGGREMEKGGPEERNRREQPHAAPPPPPPPFQNSWFCPRERGRGLNGIEGRRNGREESEKGGQGRCTVGRKSGREKGIGAKRNGL